VVIVVVRKSDVASLGLAPPGDCALASARIKKLPI